MEHGFALVFPGPDERLVVITMISIAKVLAIIMAALVA
jgi:hypothetical protein